MDNKYLKGIVKKKGDFRTYTETTDETDKLVFTREGSDFKKVICFLMDRNMVMTLSMNIHGTNP